MKWSSRRIAPERYGEQTLIPTESAIWHFASRLRLHAKVKATPGPIKARGDEQLRGSAMLLGRQKKSNLSVSKAKSAQD
jgi:hypothetical protein